MKNKKGIRNRQGGQAIITAVIFFLAISIIILVAMASPVAFQVRNTADFLQSKQAYVAADSLSEESLYRLNKGLNLPSSLVLSFNGATSSAQITDVNGTKQVIASGVAGSFIRQLKGVFSLGSGITIYYGLQVGNGGLNMGGSASITGNVYANGNIIGAGSSRITGTAIAAAATSEIADQINEASSTPAVNLSFGTTTASQDFAQSFVVSTSSAIAETQLYIKKVGTPGNATVKIMSDSSGSPSSTVLASGVLSASQVTTSYGWVDVGFTTNPSLTPGNTYWLVVDISSNSTSNYYTIGATNSNAYASGQLKTGTVGGSWTLPNVNYDSWFKVYIGGVSRIDGIVIGSGGVGDARAFNVSNSTVSGNLYCQTGTGNNKACDTSQVTPAYLSFPFSSNNVNEWKNDATAGDLYTGNLDLGNNSTTTGPMKIVGNLSIGSKGSLTMRGPLYVTGDFDLKGDLNLIPGYGTNEGVVVVDGKISIAAGANVTGSGTAGSYIVLVSNSSCGGTTSCSGSYAIDAGGNAGAVVLLTQYGGINFSGGAGAKSAVGYLMNMTGSSNLTYENGIANLNFTSGPSGGWNVDGWQEISQ